MRSRNINLHGKQAFFGVLQQRSLAIWALPALGKVIIQAVAELARLSEGARGC